MFDISKSIFNFGTNVPNDTQVIFVSDLFVDEYIGGAELTSAALIDSSKYKIFKLKSSLLNEDIISRNLDKFWIFGNFTQLNPQLIPAIIANLKYSILEYDYKYCQVRSPEKHFDLLKIPCDCHNQMNGKIISAFFHGAMHLWWMSQKQFDKYKTYFPFLEKNKNTVLSSVFSKDTIEKIKNLRESSKDLEKTKWIVFGSSSWIKGTEDAISWCENNNKEFEVLSGLTYEDMLNAMSKAKGVVYLPKGGDTCPRFVIEAKLLGCELITNDFVQHKDESWFATDDLESIENYLLKSCDRFWEGIKKEIDYRPTISAYTTVYNADCQGYPFIESIQSMLQFADEVVILDGGSSGKDATYTKLIELAYPGIDKDSIAELETYALSKCVNSELFYFPETYKQFKKDNRIIFNVLPRNWEQKNSAIFDGQQKAESRKLCTKEFCWQFDIDEVVHEDDAKKIKDLCRVMPLEADILSLPVIEYWGGEDKVRLDVQPWKWRLSRNSPKITHGIPKLLRRFDKEGNLYASEGTDGCDMIDSETFEPMGHITFYSLEVEQARQAALMGDSQAKEHYEEWFNLMTNNLPCVFHYSWFDLERKIKLYKTFWTRHWNSLFNKNIEDSAANNMMFDLPWREVTDDMIKELAVKLKNTGGHIWHSKWSGKITPWITSNRMQPAIMRKL
jgi:hypothetical protein